MLNCIIIDDEKEVGNRLQSFLKMIGKVEIISCETEPENAIKQVCVHKPDLVFVDVVMPRLTGFEVVKNIRSQGVFPHIVFVTAYQEYAIRAIKEGAFDYILKPIDLDELKQCIERYQGNNSKKQFSFQLEKNLTPREKEIMLLICEGKTSKEIAEELFISKTTVDTHRKNIIEKLGCRNISELLAKYTNHF